MKTSLKKFRPALGDVLEDRSVPSGFGGLGGFGGETGGFRELMGRGRLVGTGNSQMVGGLGSLGGSQGLTSLGSTTSPSTSLQTMSLGSGSSSLGGGMSSFGGGMGSLGGMGAGSSTLGGFGGGTSSLGGMSGVGGAMGGVGAGMGSLGGGTGGMGGFGGGTTSSVQSTDAQAVQQAFQTFEQSYANDVQTILFASGTTDPSSNAAAFNKQVSADLTTLNGAIAKAVTSLTSVAANSNLGAQIANVATVLQTQLTTNANLPTTTDAWTEQAFLAQNVQAVSLAYSEVSQLVLTSAAPTGTITQSMVRTDSEAIQSAFQDFEQGYLNLIDASATDPSTNRPAFDTAVAQLAQTLSTAVNTAVTTNLAALPSSLGTTLTNDLVTPTGGSTTTTPTDLQDRLKSLTSPTSATGQSGRFFETRSGSAINAALSQVNRDVSAAVTANNKALAGTTTAATTTPTAAASASTTLSNSNGSTSTS